MNIYPSKSMVLIALIPLMLIACDGDEPGDIREWMAESAKDLRGKVPSLPEIKALPAIIYEPGDVVQPFAIEKLFAEEIKNNKTSSSGGRGQINLDAYPLARVSLDSIRLIGTINIGQQVIAVMTTGSDAPRRARVGEYIGTNNGKIISIHSASDKSEAEVIVREVVMDKGTWVERDARIVSLGQGEQK